MLLQRYNDCRLAAAAAARRAALAACALLVAAACVPHPGGECAADAECLAGQSCQAGLCRPAPAPQCAAPCPGGFHCAAGSCALDAAPVSAWVSPDEGSVVSHGVVALAVTVQTVATDVQVRAIATPLTGTSQPLQVPLVEGAGGTFRALLDADGLAEAPYALVLTVHAGGADWPGPARGLRVDRSGPQISLQLPPLPERGAFLRTDVVQVTAFIADSGAGLDSSSPEIDAPGLPALSGTRTGLHTWAFAVPLSQPEFRSAAGPLALTLRAHDRLGNATSAPFALPVTRVLWSRDVGSGLPVRSTPALDAQHLYVGTDSGLVVGLDRQHGVPLWSRALRGPVSGSVARGERLVYAASEGGEVAGLDPDSGAPQWNCPDLPSTARFTASPAVARVAGLAEPGAVLEVLFLGHAGTVVQGGASIQGGLVAVQGQSGIPLAGGTRSCFLATQAGGGSASAAVGTDGAIYAGGTDGRAHKLRFQPDATGAFGFREEWSLPASDDLTASPALGADGSAAFGDRAGQLLWVDAAGNARTAQALSVGQKLLASPIIAFGQLLALGRDGGLAPFAAPGAALSPLVPGYVAQQLAGAGTVASTPAAGADGTLYVAAGNSLRALSPGGTSLWELPLAGAATESSPALSCDGTLYLADASGHLVAVATDSRGLAPGWPKFRRDAGNTGNAGAALCE